MRVLVTRKTLEESIFLASSQVCGMYVLSLVFGLYGTIVTTMQRERWTALSDSPCEGPDLDKAGVSLGGPEKKKERARMP